MISGDNRNVNISLFHELFLMQERNELGQCRKLRIKKMDEVIVKVGPPSIIELQ